METVSSHIKAFQPDLPSYNHAFGKVYTNFEWAGKDWPVPAKLRAPAYGSHGAMLYNLKYQQLKDKGILISPTNIDIQPIITNNSWITWKPSASGKPLEQCTVNDIHLVMGFDTVNKYLQDPPGKVTTHAAIYSNLAKWQVMAKLDFSDF